MAGPALNGSDPRIEELRGRISALDRSILEAVNERLGLVSQLKEYKSSRGVDFLDPGREESLLRELAEANGGPLSEEAVRELFTEILALVKRELARRA